MSHPSADLSSVRVTRFCNATTAMPQRDDALSDVLEEIRNGHHQPQIERLRELVATDRSAYAEQKKKLPAFTMSGTFSYRNAAFLITHSGFIQVDLDHLDGPALAATREKAKRDPHVAFGFVSPSGEGLKLGLRIDGTCHWSSFDAVEQYFYDKNYPEIDITVKDVCQLCFVSFDPELFINTNATILAR